jgi:glutamate--cysteine ligase catalytic subunit
MARAQKRDAAASGKFYFRKDVYAVGRGGTTSAASSGCSSPRGEVPLKKDKKMRNCFPPLPLMNIGALDGRPVDEEYEEMTMNEIINGKVRLKCLLDLGLERLRTG